MTPLVPLDVRQLSPQQRAQLIYSQAQSELSSRLWRAALGYGSQDAPDGGRTDARGGGMGLDALLARFAPGTGPALASADDVPADVPGDLPSDASADATFASAANAGSEPLAQTQAGGNGSTAASPIDGAAAPAGLGPNTCYGPAIASAAARTGVPAAALAAIIEAGAAKSRNGSWQCYSRSTRSSAAGLGQFLSGTWQGMAEIKGTWLNKVAREKGWLDANGRVGAANRSALLSLRYDPDASINTTADNARRNLDGLEKAGVAIDGSTEGIARAAYLGHHLGLGDAIRFSRGGLAPAHARVLLDAQVGVAKASAMIARAGDAVAAHRAWLIGFIGRHIQVGRFAV